MPGGFGFDIYYVNIDRNGRYSKPVNMGQSINTEGNEVFLQLQRRRVTFASNAHPGLGGLDVYMTVRPYRVTGSCQQELLSTLLKMIFVFI